MSPGWGCAEFSMVVDYTGTWSRSRPQRGFIGGRVLSPIAAGLNKRRNLVSTSIATHAWLWQGEQSSLDR